VDEGQVTREVVTAILGEHLGEGVACLDLERGPVGNGQETWFVRTSAPAHPRIVLRVTAAAGPLTWTRREHEAAVMRDLAAAGLPVPDVLWVSEGDQILGRDHLGLEHMPGAPAATTRGDERRELLRQLGGALAELHARPPAGGAAAEALQEELRRWRQRADDLGNLVPPLVPGLLAWLVEHLEDDGTPAMLVWGDAGLHNVLDDGGHISAMLDWELSHVGHPLEDLAVALWMEGGVVDERTEPLITAYEGAQGRSVPGAQLDRLLVLTAVTRSLMVIEGARDVVEGRLHAPTLMGLALDLPAHRLVQAAARVGYADPDAGTPAEVDVTNGAHDPDGDGQPGRPAPNVEATDAALARFLGGALLPEVSDRRLRRELKVAVALLETNARRSVEEATIDARRAEADAALIDEVRAIDPRLPDDLHRLASAVEASGIDDELRRRVRQHVLDDLIARSAPLAPLRARFGG
jgi:aminoglycoside phosphotransferase (APT) family kinase protein